MALHDVVVYYFHKCRKSMLKYRERSIITFFINRLENSFKCIYSFNCINNINVNFTNAKKRNLFAYGHMYYEELMNGYDI